MFFKRVNGKSQINNIETLIFGITSLYDNS